MRLSLGAPGGVDTPSPNVIFQRRCVLCVACMPDFGRNWKTRGMFVVAVFPRTFFRLVLRGAIFYFQGKYECTLDSTTAERCCACTHNTSEECTCFNGFTALAIHTAETNAALKSSVAVF
ncbi:hypothetical protein TRVL_10169 [Trypanosoma vivax]|nr:hypothetical protein TRVL_10169 [Trypanosoma vivax]